MKTKLQTIRTAFWVLLGIALLVSNLAINRPFPPAQEATTTSTAQIGTIVAEADAHEAVGSTDGIMVMAVVIVLIVIIPILIQRKSWSNGKGRR